MRPDYRITFVNDQARLASLAESFAAVPALALDIETADWWDPSRERVSLVQLAYRSGAELRVAVIDALAPLDLITLRRPLEQGSATKAVHNAAYDAARLARHFGIAVAPIHDTMLAARRGGERRYSLKAQAETHLGLRLDKGEQRGDWGQRPLGTRQIAYAAQDAAATLLLYEHQTARGLRGDYVARAARVGSQAALPLSEPSPHPGPHPPPAVPGDAPARARAQEDAAISDEALALLGIITELPSRYYPEQLAASVGGDRVGLAGWIVDQVLGREEDVDESAAKEEIAGLCRLGLVKITPTRSLVATESGEAVWRRRHRV